jgi:NAD(P)-dependent dehydrogenase (short-subunit alcohol dehydrogenase family)
MVVGKEIKLAVVTGAGRRLGRDLALCLARMGYALAVHYNQSEKAAASTVAEIVSQGGVARLFQADLRSPAQIENLFQCIDLMDLPIGVLVNSAAVMSAGKLPHVPLDDFDDEIALNLRAPFFCAQSAARRMTAGGSIINISDVAASKTWTKYPAYVVSKAGVESFTRLLARSLAPKIRVNAIAPGLVYKSEELRSEGWDNLLSKVPMQRAARPDEITLTLEFLLNNEYITGQTLVVDGGYSLV